MKPRRKRLVLVLVTLALASLVVLTVLLVAGPLPSGRSCTAVGTVTTVVTTTLSRVTNGTLVLQPAVMPAVLITEECG